MKTPINYDNKKPRRGRPATGAGTLIGVRLRPDEELAVDAWIEAQPTPKPSRPQAIRELVRRGLVVSS